MASGQEETVVFRGIKGNGSAPIAERCRLWRAVGKEELECAGRFYPVCGGKRRWYPCRSRYPLSSSGGV